jgi:hypothetical protein
MSCALRLGIRLVDRFDTSAIIRSRPATYLCERCLETDVGSYRPAKAGAGTLASGEVIAMAIGMWAFGSLVTVARAVLRLSQTADAGGALRCRPGMAASSACV